MRTIDGINELTKLTWDGTVEVVYNQTEEQATNGEGEMLCAYFNLAWEGDNVDKPYYLNVNYYGGRWHAMWSNWADCGEITQDFATPEEACLHLESMFANEISEAEEARKHDTRY